MSTRSRRVTTGPIRREVAVDGPGFDDDSPRRLLLRFATSALPRFRTASAVRESILDRACPEFRRTQLPSPGRWHLVLDFRPTGSAT